MLNGQTVERPTCGVQEGVSSRCGTGQDDCVDDVVQDRDSGILNTQNEGTGTCIGCSFGYSLYELGVVSRDDDRYDQGSETVEDCQTVDEAVTGFGNVAPRGFTFSSCNSNELRRQNERKA